MATTHAGHGSDSPDAHTTEPSTVEVGRRLTEVLRRAATATALPPRGIEPDAVMILVDDELAIIAEPDPVEDDAVQADAFETAPAGPVITFG